MDQIKIGKFISSKRKEVGLTQVQLAEKLNVTDRAVSKWETGRSLPDASIMLGLCSILKITVNDLLSGEVVHMDNYKEKSEEMLVEMIREKEERDRMLLRIEIVAGLLGLVPLFMVTIFVAYNQDMEELKRSIIVFASVIPFLIAMPYLLKIEQKAGYYKCAACGHTHVPTFSSVFWAMHMGRTRYMICPKCGKKSWQKKVISKE